MKETPKDLPSVSPAEWKVMKVLWAKSPLTANEIVEELLPKTTWHHKTIRTLINRLLVKKVIGYEQKGKAYDYYPLVDELTCVRAENRTFLKRVYGGALKPMLAQFIEDADLSPADIADLKRILDEKG